MKCAAAVILSETGRSVFASRSIVNQAGMPELKSDTTSTCRPPIRVVPSRCAFVIEPPQIGSGTRSGDVVVRIQRPLGDVLSHLFAPTTTAAAPLRIRYANRFGATCVQVET